ncbi:MAG: TolC family protein [Archangium sp.]|nr:TolC family protein [Archangium sp.]
MGLAVVSWSRVCVAEEPCAGPITRRNVAACALEASPLLRESLAELRAAEGRRDAARPFLPSNPVIAGSVASRVGPTDRALNWNLSLGQELEVAGQRWLRVEVSDTELSAQRSQGLVARRDISAQAWVAYFTALAAQERLALAGTLEAATNGVADTVRAMAAKGLASELDVDVAETAALRGTHERLGLEASVAASKVQLAQLTAHRPDLAVEGTLEPVAVGEVQPVSTRPELLSAQTQQVASQRRVALLERMRVPNPTVSLFAQNDGFNERVLGVGLSFPVPLPQPVGRTRAGEIVEAKAVSEHAGAATERLQRELIAELAIATAQYIAASKARQLYASERVERATTRLVRVAEQVKAARLPVREALLAQQALVEQLKAAIDAREALCVASVRLARAAGTSLEGDAL